MSRYNEYSTKCHIGVADKRRLIKPSEILSADNKAIMIWTVLLLPCVLAKNLFQNPGFESGTNGWTCLDCTGSISSDKRSGSHSFKVTGRHHDYSGATQEVQVSGGHYYYFKIWVKLLNAGNGKKHSDLLAYVDILNNNGQHEYKQVGENKFSYPGRWIFVGGDAYIPANIKSVRFYVQISEPSANYIVDDASMDEVAYLSNFAKDANSAIDHLRKADISISLAGSAQPSGLQVEVQQVNSEFAWGSAVDANLIVDSNHKAYQNFFYDIFEWAVMENACKWQSIESSKGQFNYNTPLKAINAMESRGIKMRGHNIFWGGQYIPNWQNSMNANQLRSEITNHIHGMTSHFKGKFKHWDVNNENLHEHYYEDKLNDEYITFYMFRETHKSDPNSKNFLNEYNVVADGQSTLALVDQAYWFKAAGVPVHGLGVQSHFSSYVDVSIVKRRLDEVAAAGLEIWVTELDVSEQDEHKKAQKYEDLMRLFFSHPAVKGVLFWGFWDGRHWKPQAAIANGNNVTPNAAGRKVRELLKQTWRTNETHNIKHGQNVHIRGFKGYYKLLVHHNGKVIHTENFNLGQGNQNLKINLSGSGSNPHVDKVLIG